jgi:hypothetical protein
MNLNVVNTNLVQFKFQRIHGLMKTATITHPRKTVVVAALSLAQRAFFGVQQSTAPTDQGSGAALAVAGHGLG